MHTLMFVLHGCPLHWLGVYGNEWIATPHLDQLASESIVFDSHISDCPTPTAARQAWKTGSSKGHSATSSNLLTILKEAGIPCFLIRANRTENDGPPDYYAGWDKVFDARPVSESPSLATLLENLPRIFDEIARNPNSHTVIEIDALLPPWRISQEVFEVYNEDLLEQADYDDEPIIPWCDPKVGWFDVEDEASWELLQRSCAAMMTGFDAEFEQILDALGEVAALKPLTLILTSDFGFALGEHGLIGTHRPHLHEEFVHLPLMIRLPEGKLGGLRVSAFTVPADVMPTIVDLSGLQPPTHLDGKSLRPLWEGTPTDWRDEVVTRLTLGSVSEQAIRTASWAFLLPGEQTDPEEDPRSPLLYRKPDDRWEVNDLSNREHEVVEELTQRLTGSEPPAAQG